MGHDPSVLRVLTRELQSLPHGAGILELGAQDLIRMIRNRRALLLYSRASQL